METRERCHGDVNPRFPKGLGRKKIPRDPDRKLSAQDALPRASDADAASFIRVALFSGRFLMFKVRRVLW